MKSTKTTSAATARIGLLAFVALAAVGSFTAAGCQREIGDECQTSVDCDPNGTRACDLSQPGGYCTIVGCDEKSCPESSVCVRYFPEQFLTEACNPACEDIPPCRAAQSTPDADGGAADPGASFPDCPAACQTGVENRCAADQLCLDVGLCARRSLETRACARSCSSDGDCRGGYECRRISSGEPFPDGGAQGSMLLQKKPNASTGFCAPHVVPDGS